MKLLSRIRRVCYFGYGPNRDPEMIRAIIGRRPRVIGPAVLLDHRLGIQKLTDVPITGLNPRRTLLHAWGSNFRSYVAQPHAGSEIKGTLFKISLHDRHRIDTWELIPDGWCSKEIVAIRLDSSHKLYSAETQVLGARQQPSRIVNGHNYVTYLNPKPNYLRIATVVRQTSA